ncbi:MAG: transglycosylase SLT domain-containing protein [Azospirillum sp.]|nr:transglycosylase SLT domain-containing protein [Azospirillum sp.]
MLGFAGHAATPAKTSDAVGSPVARWAPVIAEAAARFRLPAPWIADVMRAESGGHAFVGGHPTTSPKGAIGLMQVMPETFRELRRRHGLGVDPADPRYNVLAGVAYLRELYDRFGAPGFLAAYNAGPGRYQEFLAGRRPLPTETKRYLAQLAPRIGVADGPPGAAPRPPSRPPVLQELERSGAQARPAGLFVTGRAATPRPADPVSGGLFVSLKATGIHR